MKRRNFLSGLLAAPLALKARLARFFGRKPVEVCGAPLGTVVLREQPEPGWTARSFQSGAQMILALQQPIPTRLRPVYIGLASELASPIRCSLLRGHKGPHVLLNPRKLAPMMKKLLLALLSICAFVGIVLWVVTHVVHMSYLANH